MATVTINQPYKFANTEYPLGAVFTVVTNTPESPNITAKDSLNKFVVLPRSITTKPTKPTVNRNRNRANAPSTRNPNPNRSRNYDYTFNQQTYDANEWQPPLMQPVTYQHATKTVLPPARAHNEGSKIRISCKCGAHYELISPQEIESWSAEHRVIEQVVQACSKCRALNHSQTTRS